MSSPKDILQEGARILQPLLEQHGFSFCVTNEGRGAGGPFAVGEFRQGLLSLECHFRYSLGIVLYFAGVHSVSHDAYMKHLGAEDCSYPGFSDDPLDGFQHLLADLQSYGRPFLAGDTSALIEASRLEAEDTRRLSHQAMIESVGDRRLRNEARDHFRAGRYAEASEVFARLKYPEDLSPAERRMFDMAEVRSHDI